MKRLISLILILVLCLSLCACGKADDYESAVALMEVGNYEEAIAAFTELGDYEDSAQKLEECKNILAYNEATALFEIEKYEDALAIFVSLGNYRDSAEKATECEMAIAYSKAVSLLNAGEYEQAYKALCELGDYKDVAELLTHFVEVVITPENWSEYFVVVEEPTFIKNDFNENTDIFLCYFLRMDDSCAKRIYNANESKVIFEFTFSITAKDVQFSKTSDEYELFPPNPISSGHSHKNTENRTCSWDASNLEDKEVYYPGRYASVITEYNEEIPGAWLLAENFEALRTQGSIFIYE